MNKRLEYLSLIKKLISCESREQLSDIIKEINEFNKEYSITSTSEEFKKFEIAIGVMRVKLKRKHDIAENQLRSQKQNNKINMKIIITERQETILEGLILEGKNKPTNPQLWAQCLAWARSRYDVCPSAYCNGAAAKRYKSKGGGWRKVKKSTNESEETNEASSPAQQAAIAINMKKKGIKPKNENVNEDLKRWFKEKWVDVSKKVDGKHPPCGRKDADGKAYPKCRPSKKVSSETPKVASSYDKDEKKAMTQQKRRAEKKDPKIGKGNKPTMTSYKKK
jgi:hypothetical protein